MRIIGYLIVLYEIVAERCTATKGVGAGLPSGRSASKALEPVSFSLSDVETLGEGALS